MKETTFQQAAKLFDKRKDWQQAKDFFNINPSEYEVALNKKTKRECQIDRVTRFLNEARNVSSETVKGQIAEAMLAAVEKKISGEIESINISIETL